GPTAQQAQGSEALFRGRLRISDRGAGLLEQYIEASNGRLQFARSNFPQRRAALVQGVEKVGQHVELPWRYRASCQTIQEGGRGAHLAVTVSTAEQVFDDAGRRVTAKRENGCGHRFNIFCMYRADPGGCKIRVSRAPAV